MSIVKNKWLIKSDNRILGPYSYEQIEELIQKKQISLIDEIRDTERRWSYVRELEEFKHLIDDVRKELDQKADMTRTIQTGSSQIATKTSSVVDLSGATALTKTTELQIDGENPEAKVNFENTDVKNEGSPLASANKVAPTYYTPSAATAAKTPGSSTKKWIIAAGVIFLIGAGCFAGLYYNEKQNKAESAKNQILEIRRLAYEKNTAKLFEKISALDGSLLPKALVEVIPYWNQMDQQGVMNSQKIMSLIDKNTLTLEQKNKIELVKFNQNFQKGEFKEANQNIINAFDFLPNSEETRENDAILSFYERKYQESAKKFKDLYDRNLKGRFLLAYVVSQIRTGSFNAEQLTMMVDSFLVSNLDFKKELLTLKLYLLSVSGLENSAKFSKTLHQFLNFPIQFSDLFSIEDLVYSSFYGWVLLNDEVKKVESHLANADKTEWQIQHLAEQDRFEDAKKLALDSKSILSEDKLANILIQIAYLTKDKSGLEDLYQAALNGSIKLNLAACLDVMRSRYVNKAPGKELENVKTKCLPLATSQDPKDVVPPLITKWMDAMTELRLNNKSKVHSLLSSEENFSQYFLPFRSIKGEANE